MAISERQFDSHYGMAHILKLFSYGIVIAGAFSEVHRLYLSERLAREAIGEINLELNESNLRLTTASTTLRRSMP